MLRRIAPFLLLAACTAADETPPTLTVTSPARGALQDELTVTVTGTTDAREVRINGLAADVAADGSFSLTFAVPPGIDVIETIAIDDAGNEERDVRAVLAGPLAPTSGAVDDALAARLGPDAFAVVSDVVAERIEGLELAALVGGDGPLVSIGGESFGAEVTLTGVALANVDLALVPTEGALATSVAVDGLDVQLRLDYRVGGVAHTSNVVVHADRVAADASLALSAELRSSIAELQIGLEGLDFTADGLPGEILDLVEGPIESIGPTVAEAVITDVLPGLVDELLADLAARELSLPVLERDLSIALTPAAVTIDPTGVFVALRGGLHVSGDLDGRYLATPAAAAPALEGHSGSVALGVSDDAINQLFAGMWASGALGHDLALPPGDPLKLLLGGDTSTLAVTMKLPPTATADATGDLRLVIGEVDVVGTADDGTEMVHLSMSMATTLGATADDRGHVTLELGEPTVHADVLAYSDRVERPISDDNVEQLVRGLYRVIAHEADEALRHVPIPAFEGLRLVRPGVDSRAGFVVLHTGVGAGD
jgi:hypothetical protein